MQKPTIMVVEDDADIREAVSEALREGGYRVIMAENGQDALTLLREHRDVRAIVLDLVMPVMNGATFRGQQLEDPEIASIPLILLTGRDDATPIGTALAVSACIQKPFTPEELLRVVEQHRLR